MSRITEVIKNKNRVQKAQQQRRKAELDMLNKKASFNASLSEELKHLETLLNSDEIESITIRVNQDQLVSFNEAIYSDMMKIYEVTQKEPDVFEIRLKTI